MVHTHLVTWQEFMREKENKNLSITEAKSKYQKLEKQFNLLMEAEVAAYNAVALNSVRNGAQGGPGEELNPILGIEFTNPPVGTITGFTSTIAVSYTFPVTVIGAPVLFVNNNQLGGGSGNIIQYSSSAGGNSKIVEFSYGQVADANGGTLVAAKKITLDNELVGSIGTQPTTPVNNTYVGEVITWASGAGGTGGDDITATIIVAGAAVTSIKVTATPVAANYQPGNIFTLAGSALGGTGNLVFTLVAADLTGDTLTLQAIGDGVNTGIATSAGNTINLIQGGSAGEPIGSKYDSVGGSQPTQLGTPATATA